jgi:hypothetical protein
MLFGFEEAAQNGRRYYEFRYKTIIKRTEKSEGFKCFQGNDLQVFEHESSIFMETESDYNYLVSSWHDHYGIYSYIALGIVKPRKSMSATEVVSLIYQRNNFKHIVQMTTIGSIEWIS